MTDQRDKETGTTSGYVASSCCQAPHLLAINGVYKHAVYGVVILTDVLGSVVSVRQARTMANHVVKTKELTGPTHLPCPHCGEMKQTQSDGMTIDLGEHIERAHPMS